MQSNTPPKNVGSILAEGPQRPGQPFKLLNIENSHGKGADSVVTIKEKTPEAAIRAARDAACQVVAGLYVKGDTDKKFAAKLDKVPSLLRRAADQFASEPEFSSASRILNEIAREEQDLKTALHTTAPSLDGHQGQFVAAAMWAREEMGARFETAAAVLGLNLSEARAR